MTKEQAAHFILRQFIDLETQFQATLSYIPYVEENKGVLSPKYSTILIDACSLIDSIFRDLVGEKKRSSLKDYASLFEPSINLEQNLTLYLNTPLTILSPFESWRTSQPSWWNAYNKLKHDRINNFDSATLENTLLAVCALHQVMARCKVFLGPFLKEGWINTSDVDLAGNLASVAHLGALTPSPPSMVIESQLFVSPTRENFISATETQPLYLNVDYDIPNLSSRVKDFIWAHEDF